MLRVKKNFFRFLNAILAIALSLVGYESCTRETAENAEYGTPTADYIFRGKVTDMEGNALSNVKVSYVEERTYDNKTSIWEVPLTSTDEEGMYVAKYRNGCWWNVAGLRFSMGDDLYKDTFLTRSQLAPMEGGDGKWFEGRSDNTLNINLNK